MTKYKPQLYEDPLAEIGSFKFSDLFEDGAPAPAFDFEVQVYRSGHRKVRAGTIALARTLDFPKMARIAELARNQPEDAPDEEKEAAAVEMVKLMGELPEGQMASVMDAYGGGKVGHMVHDIIGLPVEGEDDEVATINLSDVPEEERGEVLRDVLAANEHLEPWIRSVSEQKEEEFQSYVKQAKNASAPTLTGTQGGPQSSSGSSSDSDAGSTSSLDVQ